MKISQVKKKIKRTESPIVRACCDYLAVKRHFFWRQNNAGVMRTDLKGRKFWTTPVHSRKGIPDIFVMLLIEGKYHGVFVKHTKTYAIEIKTEVGRQSPEQKDFQMEWELRGGTYILARSVDDLIKAGL